MPVLGLLDFDSVHANSASGDFPMHGKPRMNFRLTITQSQAWPSWEKGLRNLISLVQT